MSPGYTTHPLTAVGRERLRSAKCLDNHLGALWDFIHRYNASLP